MTTDTNRTQSLTRHLGLDQAAALHEYFFYDLDSDAFPMAPALFDAFMAATGYASVPPCEDVLKGALDAALWTGMAYNAETQEGESKDLRRPHSEVPEHIVASLRDDVQQFLRSQADEVQRAVVLYGPLLDVADWTVGEQIGHDFMLTRNREGAGFWDRGLGAVGDLLTQASHPYGSFGIEADDEGDLHLSS